MPNVTLLPNGTGAGNDTSWTLGAGASKLAAVQTNDGGTSFITSTIVADRNSFDMDNMPSAASAINGEPVHHGVMATSGSKNFKLYFKLSGTNADGVAQNATGTYTDYSDTPGRPGGGAWSVADVNAVMAGVQTGGAGSGNITCTQIYAVVTYSVPSGGFAFLVASFLGPLIAIGIRDLPGIARAVWARDRRWRHVIEPGEYLAALRDLREARWPCYFFRPGAGLVGA